jgi:cytochrome c oxidase subunit 1
MFATPLFFAFGNLIMPLQIGAPDVAFPRLNAFSFGCSSSAARSPSRAFATRAARRISAGTAYAPLSHVVHSPGPGANLGSPDLAVSGLGTILARSTSSPRSSACARRA